MDTRLRGYGKVKAGITEEKAVMTGKERFSEPKHHGVQSQFSGRLSDKLNRQSNSSLIQLT